MFVQLTLGNKSNRLRPIYTLCDAASYIDDSITSICYSYADIFYVERITRFLQLSYSQRKYNMGELRGLIVQVFKCLIAFSLPD